MYLPERGIAIEFCQSTSHNIPGVDGFNTEYKKRRVLTVYGVPAAKMTYVLLYADEAFLRFENRVPPLLYMIPILHQGIIIHASCHTQSIPPTRSRPRSIARPTLKLTSNAGTRPCPAPSFQDHPPVSSLQRPSLLLPVAHLPHKSVCHGALIQPSYHHSPEC